jgi:hypothetical protein
MQHRKIERNKDLVLKHKQGWSYRKLGRFFRIDVRWAWEIFQRDKDLYNLEENKTT